MPLPKKKKQRRNIFRIAGKIFLWMFIAQLVYIIILRWVNPPFTVTQLVSIMRGNGIKRDYVSYNEMSREAKLAVMAGEDQLFPDHNGFDLKAIKLAVKYNKRHPGKVRGASTISQQVAKNVFLWQGGGYFRKGLEVYFTFMIETFWGKKRILQMYLNVAETGKGVFGIQAAARRYFGKDAKDLTRNEAAQIAAALPNPVRFTVKPLSKYVSVRSGYIMRQMGNLSRDPDIQKILE
ncbi:MAG: monofunctional biosynthetic peptidoglycan transglycosylase [Ferruginibacter sp.]